MPVSHQRVVRKLVSIDGSVPAGQTLDLDTFLLSDFKSIKYIQTFYNDAQTKSKVQEMLATKEAGGISDTVYAKSGDSISLSVNLVIQGTDGRLRVTNNESFDVSFSILKFIL